MVQCSLVGRRKITGKNRNWNFCSNMAAVCSQNWRHLYHSCGLRSKSCKYKFRHCDFMYSIFIFLCSISATYSLYSRCDLSTGILYEYRPMDMHMDKYRFITGTRLRYVPVFAIANPSVCLSASCNVRATYSQSWSFRQHFFTAVYLSHLLTSVQNFTEIVPNRGVKRKRGNKTEPWWTYRRLYLINGTRYSLGYN